MSTNTAGKYQPTAAEREDFDYHWQHLRRNERYRAFCSAYEDCLCPQSKGLSGVLIRRKVNRRVREYGKLPQPLNPDISDSQEAMRLVLEIVPDYFQSPLWHAAQAKRPVLVAVWNKEGPDGCGWRCTEPPKHERTRYTLPPEKPWLQFWRAMRVVNEMERCFNNPKLFEQLASLRGAGTEGRRKLLKEFRAGRATLRSLLEARSRMDFVLDTSLPWASVAKALKAEWDNIKQLRQRIGLEPDVEPSRRRAMWFRQLQLHDIYLPHWKSNRRKRQALSAIWRENVGFLQAFDVLGLKMTKEDLALAEKLDQHGRRPKGFYSFFEQKAKEALIGGGWDEGIEFVSRRRERRLKREALHSDEANETELTAMVSKKALRELPADYFGEVGAVLDSWRLHFSIPRVRLPAPFEGLSRKTRNRWFHAARGRVKAAWASPEPDSYPLPAT